MDTMKEEFLENSEQGPFYIYDEDDSEFQTPENPQPVKKARKTYKQDQKSILNGLTMILKKTDAVEERPTLWDISSSQYKLPKTSAQQEIADFIGERTADECKAKSSSNL